MNPFQRARAEARRVRDELVPGRSADPLTAGELMCRVEDVVGLGIEPVDRNYPDLCGGSAVLQQEQCFIYISSEFEEGSDRYFGLAAHELGHWFLDARGSATTVAHLKTLFGGDGSPAVVKVEAYGARERQELQANVFARELLLPRGVARSLATKGKGPAAVAQALNIPLEFVRQQMLDALLLPDFEESNGTLKPPSPDQLAAAEAPERFANVVAGPGTGKTSTLIHRVKYLVQKLKVDPSQILVLTFTNKAAFELVERLRSAGLERAADVWAGTFHAFGLEFLRKYHQYFDLEPDLNVADKLNVMTMMAAALPTVDLKYYLRVQDPYDWLGPVVDAIKRLKEELVSPAQYRQRIAKLPEQNEDLRRRREDVATLYELHESLLAQRKTVDFVDLIAKPALAIRRDRSPYSALADKFQYILVDEYQDVTQAMVELLRQMAHKVKSLWVVGDVRQAIHHWRGASVKSLTRFDAEFKAQAGSSRIRSYALDNNRRSTQEVLDLVEQAGKIHALQPRLPLATLVAEKGRCGDMPVVVTCREHAQVLHAVHAGIEECRNAGVPYGDQAVLCRRGADVEKTADLLSSAGVPVLYIGELAQRPEVKRILCLMQLLVERQPRALVGLMQSEGMAMPMVDVRKFLDAADSDVRWQRGKWLRGDLPPGLSTKAKKVATKLGKLLAGRTHASNPWGLVCDLLLEHGVGVPEESDQSVASWVTRIALWQFAYAVRNGDGELKEARLSRYLLRQRLRQRIGDTYVDREMPPEAGALDAVRVQTIHGSKGLEYEAVHLAFVNAGSFGQAPPTWGSAESILDIVPPEVLGSSRAEYEDEAAIERNNLFYVALSRAKRHLWLYQDTEYGADRLAPQLQHTPRRYRELEFQGKSVSAGSTAVLQAFESPREAVAFSDFDSYVICALQYWYSNVLSLRKEQEVEIAVRARWAIMAALRSVASGSPGTPARHLSAEWVKHRLPDQSLDSTLARDAALVFRRGLAAVNQIRGQGGVFAEPTATVGGVEIALPWGLLVQERHAARFHLFRFSRQRVEDVKTLLRPMVAGMNVKGPCMLTVRSVLSELADDVPASKRVDWTNAYKAAVRMTGGDNRPTRGRHCGRCAYMTICPSAPLDVRS